jgi:hypothetical protein
MLKMICKDDIQIAGYSFLWNVMWEKQVISYPRWQKLVDLKVTGALM